MKYAAVHEDVVLTQPDFVLPSTIALPASDDKAPCVVFFAGSGPTDRNWTSPLLPGKNGSGAQIAVALQERGIGSIRFDKVGSGVNMPKSPADMQMLAVLSLAHYVDEALTAFDEMKARPQCGPIFLLGHSEGSLHASSAAVRVQDDARFGGFISLAGPSRSILDTAIEQIRALRMKANADARTVDDALTAFRAAMLQPDAPSPDFTAIPEAAALWQAAHAPVQQKVARELMLGDPLTSLRAYRGRALVVSAANDAQVPVADGDAIVAALASDASKKERVTIANANHVFKVETRAPSTIGAQEIVAGYADDDHALADGVVDAIARFVLGRASS